MDLRHAPVGSLSLSLGGRPVIKLDQVNHLLPVAFLDEPTLELPLQLWIGANICALAS